ncbi:hypothetical protein [Bacillus thuringiensis]|uniref:hypothetical protein n=1 Tax=Bacillus thuringiensis TaxID=1428 RepID=UPI000E2F67DC|nr:hypothetical protein [Bacillus thuringiensis]RFB54215.1 hypothetical protein DZB90_20825 [Bacillus thuringiensis]
MGLKKLHEQFLKSQLPYKHSINEVRKLITFKYKAILIKKEELVNLMLDPYINYKTIECVFGINDEKILRGLLSTEEKNNRDFIENEIMNDSKITDSEKQQLIKEGREIVIIIESIDKRFISNFTIQGNSKQLLNELLVLKGINQAECVLTNEEYKTFLNALVIAKYI